MFKFNHTFEHEDQKSYAMSTKWIICLFIFGFVSSAHSAQFQTKPYQHPDYPGQCYDEETKESVPVGKSINNSRMCKWQECQPDFSFVGSTCAPSAPPPGCSITKPDFSKPYPGCCPRPVC